MAEVLTPDVSVQERGAALTQIAPVASRVPAFFGVTQRGPVDEVTTVTSFADFERQFGDLKSGYEQSWLQVRDFFANAGEGLTLAYFVRTVHHLIQGDPSSAQATAGTLTLQTDTGSATLASITSGNAEPFTGISTGDGLTFGSVDGVGPQTATFTGDVAVLVAGAAGTYALTDGMTLTLLADDLLATTVTFTAGQFPDIANATAAQVAASINSQTGGTYAFDNAGTLELRSQTGGTDGLINVTGGTANAILLFSTTPVAGTGNVADISAVTAAEVKTIVEAAITTPQVNVNVLTGGFVQFVSAGTPGPTSELQINAGPVQASLNVPITTFNGVTGAPVNTLQLDGRTPYDNSTVQVRVAIPSSSGDAGRFDLFVVEDGVDRETYRDLTMDQNDDRYVVTILNQAIDAGGSSRILATDLFALASDPRPAVGLSAVFTGGDDGLSGLVDEDFIGGVSGETKTGFRLLDELMGTEQAPQIGPLVPGRSSSAMWNAQRTYAEFTSGGTDAGAMVTILDTVSSDDSVEAHKTSVEASGLLGLSEYVTWYYPRGQVLNPSRTVFGTVDRVEVGVAGAMAGLWARQDAVGEFGVGEAPAGLNSKGEVRGWVGVTDDRVTDLSKRKILGLANTNVIRPRKKARTPSETRAVHAADAITGRRATQGARFPQLQERRLVIFIERSLDFSFQVVLLDPNTLENRRTNDRQIRDFLQGIQDAGKLVFYDTDIGPTVNTEQSINQGIFRDAISLKTVKATRAIELVFEAAQ